MAAYQEGGITYYSQGSRGGGNRGRGRGGGNRCRGRGGGKSKETTYYITSSFEQSIVDEKCGYKQFAIFPELDEKTILSLELPNELIIYSTIFSISKQINKIIIDELREFDLFPQDCVLVDGTAGIGGNSMHFSTEFKKVIALENDQTTFSYIEYITQLHGRNNVELLNEDIVDYIDELEHMDVLFLDPVWGDKCNLPNKITLTLSKNISLEKFIKETIDKRNQTLIVVKVPLNYNIDFFTKSVAPYKCKDIKLKKMIILVVNIN